MDSHNIERRVFLFAPKVIKQSDSSCLSVQRVVRVQSDSPCPLQVCVRSGKHQCLNGPILCEVEVSQIRKKRKKGKRESIVTKRESTRHPYKKLVLKIRAKNS